MMTADCKIAAATGRGVLAALSEKRESTFRHVSMYVQRAAVNSLVGDQTEESLDQVERGSVDRDEVNRGPHTGIKWDVRRRSATPSIQSPSRMNWTLDLHTTNFRGQRMLSLHTRFDAAFRGEHPNVYRVQPIPRCRRR